MTKINHQIKVRELHSGQELLSCPLDQESEAFRFAHEMEAMGVEVEVINPSVSETLAASLGVGDLEWEEYRESMEDEIHDHQ